MEIPAWIEDNPKQFKPTEILLPVTEGIAPVWDHQRDLGGWYARLDVVPNPSGDPVWECDHVHASEAEAWACVADLSRSLATARASFVLADYIEGR